MIFDDATFGGRENQKNMDLSQKPCEQIVERRR
jgi:hypothetical protein